MKRRRPNYSMANYWEIYETRLAASDGLTLAQFRARSLDERGINPDLTNKEKI